MTKRILTMILASVIAITMQAQQSAPFEKPQIAEPAFGDYSVSITSYGAIGDGIRLNTADIQKAIDETSAKGGGKVVIPAGVWLTGPITLKSNINLHLDKAAIVMFSRNHADYPAKSDGKKVVSPINGEKISNIAITGEGVFDASGDTWRPAKRSKFTDSQWKQMLSDGGQVIGDVIWPAGVNPKNDTRPYLMEIKGCTRVLIDGPTFQNSPMFVMCPRDCSNMIIRNIKVLNEWYAQNGDGIDLSNCTDVILSNCMVSVGDDGICMKSSNPSPGVARLRNIWIENCTVYHGHGGFVIGSNTEGGMHNIYVTNCKFMYTDTGLRFKSARDRGGLVDNIFIDGIYMKDIQNAAITFDTYYENIPAGEKADKKAITDRTPHFTDISISNVVCNGAKQALYINGLPEMPIENVTFNHVVIKAKTATDEHFSRNIDKKGLHIITE
jgi:parallel beta-helix repeat protein